MPSLASIFPFLEAIRPEGSPAWHINRARLLQRYDSAWIMYAGQSTASGSLMTLISFRGNLLVDMDTLTIDCDCLFVLLLLPQAWTVKGFNDQLLTTCTKVVSSASPGRVIRREEFDLY